MPRTRGDRSAALSGDDAEIDGDTVATFSSGQVAAMMAAMQQSQTEAFERLLEKVISRQPPSPVPNSASPSQAVGSGTFTHCTARFGGDADESVDAFIDAIQSYKDCANVSEENALRGLSMVLTNNAAIWYQGVKKEIQTWDNVIELLIHTYGDKRPPHRIYIELFEQRQGDQNTDVFVAKCRALLSKIPANEISDKAQVDMVYGLLDSRIRKHLRREDFTNFSGMLRLARSIDIEVSETRTQPQPGPPSSSGFTKSTSTGSGPANRNGSMARAPAPQPRRSTAPTTSSAGNAEAAASSHQHAKARCVYCKQYGHVRDECNKLVNKSGGSDKSLSCYGCGAKGVMRSQCTKCNSNLSFSSVTIETYSSDLVSEYNHIIPPTFSANSAVHRNKQKRDAHSKSYRSPPGLQSQTCECINNNNLCCDCRTFGSSCKSGSFVDSSERVDVPVIVHNNSDPPVRVNTSVIVSTRGLYGSNVDQFDTPSVVPSFCADPTATTICGGVTSTVPLSTSHVLPTTTARSKQQRPVLSIQILGLRGMALIDTAARCSIAGHTLYKIFKEKGLTFGSKQVNVKLADGVVRSREVLVASVDVIICMNKSVRMDFVIFPDADNNDTLLGIDFLNATGMVIDFSASSWHLSGCTQTYPLEYEDEPVSQLNPISVSSTCMSLRADEGLLLPCEQRQQLTDLLQHHEDVFRLGGEATRYAEHRIDTEGHAPIAVPPYRLTPAKRAAMEAEINKMLKDGVIEECKSAWAAPALLVPKKDGSTRFCVDYRRLNAVTKSDTYPLPVIEDLLHATKREGYMSTIDLRSGYWQVIVSPADRDKTAFVSPFGTYRFIRMPFGLKNAPATFQRLMDRFRSGSALKDVTLLVYLDDLLVLSDGPFQKHLEDLDAVFNRLRVFGLRANRDKCNFACNQVKYLGHLITPKGIMPDESKVQAIQQMNEPTNLKHLKSFLQTCSWFRKFVPGFSEIAQPLTKLTKKNEPWAWTVDQQRAFNELKKKLITAPVLVQADHRKPFIIHTETVEPIQPRRLRGRPPKTKMKARS